MADAFSSSSETVIQRVLDVNPNGNTPTEDLHGRKLHVCHFSIMDSFVFFLFLQVALQFPDELLVDSAAVAEEIERNSQAKTFILGDTSYGRYCNPTAWCTTAAPASARPGGFPSCTSLRRGRWTCRRAAPPSGSFTRTGRRTSSSSVTSTTTMPSVSFPRETYPGLC
uniref:Uncharacterized protein n=1 Tax=Fundulus heteroclitus TaxID=8078 RepID=A0A3Q2PNI7_FUNHE